MFHRKFINLLYHLTLTIVIYHKSIYGDFSNEYYSERALTDPMNTHLQFTNKLVSVQYNSAMALTGCIRGTSEEKLYSELGLSCFFDRRQFHRLSLYELTPAYLKCTIQNPAFNLYNIRRRRKTCICSCSYKI